MRNTMQGWRKEKGISIEAIAKWLDVSPEKYQRMEAHPGKLSIERGLEISYFLQVPLDDIIFTG